MSGDACCHSPAIHIVRGEPSDEELAALIATLAALIATLAALIATLAALRGATTAEPPAPRGAWADPAHRLRTPLRPGAWRNSALPH